MSALRVAALRAGGIGLRWTRARLVARGCLAEPAVGSPPRYHWQARRGEASRGADRAMLDDTSLVAEPHSLGRSRARPSSAPLLRRSASPSAGGALSAPWTSSARNRVSAWDTALARAALGVNTVDSSCPLTQRAARLLAHGRRSNTKHSYCGKWRSFVEFCTVTLQQLYLQRPRRPLPASPRTVLLYIAHLSEEGLVSESSLNPYMAAINQAHEDRGWARPALGHYFRLARAGWRALEGAERDAQGSRSTRMPVPALPSSFITRPRSALEGVAIVL
jgi:hypothetical protein